MVDLYQKRKAIHPRSFKGLYRNLRLLGAGFLVILWQTLAAPTPGRLRQRPGGDDRTVSVDPGQPHHDGNGSIA